MPRAPSRRTPPSASGDDERADLAGDAHLVRCERWAGLRPGDPVAVEGVRARAASWAFLAHVRNARTGDEWVEVVGGRPGDRSVRSFRPEQIFVPHAGDGARARPRLSLAEEPRLPL